MFLIHWKRVPQASGSYGEGSFTIRLQVVIRSFNQTFKPEHRFLCIVINKVLYILRGQFCSSFKGQEQNLKHNSIIDWQPMKYLQHWTNMVRLCSVHIEVSVTDS